jgi:hypothetical protein
VQKSARHDGREGARSMVRFFARELGVWQRRENVASRALAERVAGGGVVPFLDEATVD